MSLGSDLRVLYNLAFTRVKGSDHAERLEAFYRQQAGAYDEFRKRLLHGREEMMRGLDIHAGDRMLDMGGGTGSNVERSATVWRCSPACTSSICAPRC